MKKITFIITLLFAFVCGNGLLQAAPLSEAADTLDQYNINGQLLDHFDGTALVGKTITAYEMSIINHPDKGPVRIHVIHFNFAQEHAGQPNIVIRPNGTSVLSPAPVFVIDGKQVSAAEFEQLHPLDIKNMTIVKNGSQEDVKKYEGWENGVVLVETKAGSAQGKNK